MRAQFSPDDSPARYSLWAAAAILLSAGVVALQGAKPQNPEFPEVSSQETTPPFTVQVRHNEVLVRALVRDADGKVVTNLTKNDFRLFDNGKEQPVSFFAVENFAARASGAPISVPPAPQEVPSEGKPVTAAGMAQRFTALFFDDLVMPFEDIARTRAAAEHYLESSLQPTDRAGIFTSSGLGAVDFTTDRDRLHTALADLRPRPRNIRAEYDCPPLEPYEAYLIEELHDQDMIQIAKWEYIACACGGDPHYCQDAENKARSAATLAWANDEVQSRQSLQVLTGLVRRLALLPGQRNILWLSPGFLALTLPQDLSELTDRALRNHVVINALDSRGLWVDIPGGDASEHNILPFTSTIDNSIGPSMFTKLAAYRRTAREMNEDVMAEISHDTGGVFIHNTNDYEGGFRRAGGLPESSYLLGFTPQNLKYDGKFHKLRVEVVAAKNLTVQARNGYFAPKEATDSAALADQKIEEAVFSTEEIGGLPVYVETQFFKLDAAKARLSVIARLDLRSFHLRKEGNRNLDDLKLVFAVFDQDGNLVTAKQKHLELLLRDQSLALLQGSGLRVKTAFDVAAGTYRIRVVVTETRAAQLSAVSKAVEIPF